MKTKLLCLSCILAALCCADASHAAVIMTLEQVDPTTVVATASGTVNLAGLTSIGSGTNFGEIAPSAALLAEGTISSTDHYSGISGPSNFGPGLGTVASTSTGDPLGIFGYDQTIAVPAGYVSNTPLSTSTATWDNTNLATLGVTPGTYTWTWGSVASGDADSLTLYAGVPAPTSVPEPAPALLLTLAAAGLALLKRIKK